MPSQPLRMVVLTIAPVASRVEGDSGDGVTKPGTRMVPPVAPRSFAVGPTLSYEQLATSGSARCALRPLYAHAE